MTQNGKAQKIKCVVWDLDHTLWDGVLLEDKQVSLRDETVRVIKTLDERGILQSIASKNDHDFAMQALRSQGLDHYFLYPQIGWGSKAKSIERIAQSINIGLDTFAFVDDQPFERDEVQFSLPQVRCIDALDVAQIPEMPAMNPRFITSDSKKRRQMYWSDITRNQAEATFDGPKQSFLASLEMKLKLFPAREQDLQRAEELTVRTNQLNATGYTYDYDELNHFRQSPNHKLLMASLDDKYGTYGHIGLSLIECTNTIWTIKLLLMSCRVMSRGVGSIMLSHIMEQAKANNIRLQAEFVPNGRNRMMNITYRFAGFEEISQIGDCQIFSHDLTSIQPFPDYVTVQILSETKSN